MTSEPTTALPQKTDYGIFERIVEPGRHVYVSTDYRRWMIGGFCVIASLAFAWGGWELYPSPKELADPTMRGMGLAIALVPIVGSIVFALLAIAVLWTPLRLTITRDDVALFCVSIFFWKFGTTKWRTDDVLSINIKTWPVSRIGGMTLFYSPIIEFVDGTKVNLHRTFQDRRVIERLTNDIKESIIQLTQQG